MRKRIAVSLLVVGGICIFVALLGAAASTTQPFLQAGETFGTSMLLFIGGVASAVASPVVERLGT